MEEEWQSLMQLSLLQRMRIAQSIANGISVLHSRGVVHADIKPANFFFDHRTCSIQILDIDGGGYFGIERGIQQFSPSAAYISRYAAPEILLSEVWTGIWEVEGRRLQPDLWALAVLVYDIVVDGRGPFPQGSKGVMSSILDWPTVDQKVKFNELGINSELQTLFIEVFTAKHRTQVDHPRPSAMHWGAVLRRAIERCLPASATCPKCDYRIENLSNLICPRCAGLNRTTPIWGYTTCPRGHKTPARSPYYPSQVYCMHRNCGMEID